MFSSLPGLIFGIFSSIAFLIIPAVNHVRMLLAIRRHNNLVAGQAVMQPLSQVFRREKKVAMDMAIVILALLLSLAPMLLNKINEKLFPKLYAALQPWALTMVFLISSFNPLLYMLRNKALRDRMKSILSVY